MRTKFTELVGCDLPIQQAAFGSLSVELVAAVSAAGALGMIGAPLVTADVLAAAFDEIRARTHAPAGVNFVVPFFDLARDAAALDVAIERGALVEFFYGAPDHDLVERVHVGGCLAAWQVGSVADAVAAARVSSIVTVMPQVTRNADGSRSLKIPREAGYGISELFVAAGERTAAGR